MEAPATVLVERYENQRWFPSRGWTSKLLLTDRYPWSDRTGKVNMEDAGLPAGYEWLSKWELEPPSRDIDAAWCYSINFHGVGKSCRRKPKWTDCTRWRRWIRVAYMRTTGGGGNLVANPAAMLDRVAEGDAEGEGEGKADDHFWSAFSSSDPPEYLCCPITYELYKSPVITPDGHSYEAAVLKDTLRKKAEDPQTRRPLTYQQCAPNLTLMAAVNDWKSFIANREAHGRGSKIPPFMICPLSERLLDDPVTVPSGYTYDREALLGYISVRGVDPIKRTKLSLTSSIIVNRNIQELAQAYAKHQQ